MLGRLLLLTALFAGLLLSGVARADGARVRYAEIVPDSGEYVINADIALELNARVVEAISHGVAVAFVAEALIESPRWYWFDETLASARLSYRLSYHPLTRSYRLAVGSLHQNFDSLEEALRTITRIRRWRITSMRTLEPGTSYDVSLRFRLDTATLPRPFQVSALGSRDWQIESDWLRWTFLASPYAR